MRWSSRGACGGMGREGGNEKISSSCTSMAPDGLRLLSALVLAQILLGGYVKLSYGRLYTV